MSTKTIRIKGANGTVYIYEDRAFRDKERGYPTHERKCIGKVGPDGEPVYNEFYLTREKVSGLEREVSETRAKAAERTVPVSSTTLMGQGLVLDKEAGKIGIGKALEAAFGAEDAGRVTALAYYLICRGKALSRSEQWLEARGFGKLGLTTQRVSELLERLSDDRINTFFSKWVPLYPHWNDTCLFDITSVSTYGRDNHFAEYGYNRDGESDMEQINLAMLVSCSTGLPVWYDPLPGSMADVAVLDTTLGKLSKFGMKGFTFCGDRGFFSERNLRMLSDRKIKFLIPIPSRVSISRELIRKHRASLIHPDHFIDDGVRKMYGKTVYQKTEYGDTWYHIYFDPARKDKAQASFMQRLRECKAELEAGELLESHQSLYDEYFIIKDNKRRGVKVTYNDDALQKFLDNDSCYWVLMSTYEKNAAKALASYRERGGIELMFDDMKNLLDLNRLRGHNERTVKGKIFINFVALCILASLRKTVDAIPDKERKYMSETDMLDRVDTYTKVHFAGKRRDVFSTPTKTQRLIFDLLGIKYEYKGDIQNADPKIPSSL